ncbi:DUF1294 domain-containing protein [Bacillus infantis]|uniref:DUF1294 domain-containing protein n=1 Tax=Bacillus infantis TaxID=324767 RepID=UPI0021558C1D|nr:DUF1294 domain-containing protein [Bacillus infantis]MCR6612246.1 DUF1294 domain-containing protein [Bacillus infantis]
MEWAALYLLLINAAGFFIMRADKQKARKNQYRISERTLWTIAFVFGAPGMYAGMNKFRHKTKHDAFKYGLPALSMLEAAVCIYLLAVWS